MVIITVNGVYDTYAASQVEDMSELLNNFFMLNKVQNQFSQISMATNFKILQRETATPNDILDLATTYMLNVNHIQSYHPAHL